MMFRHHILTYRDGVVHFVNKVPTPKENGNVILKPTPVRGLTPTTEEEEEDNDDYPEESANGVSSQKVEVNDDQTESSAGDESEDE
jgi:hypothetical protein